MTNLETTIMNHLEENFDNANHNMTEGFFEYENENGEMAFFCWDTEAEMADAIRNNNL